MNNAVNLEKFRRLSIASIITGILPYIYALLSWLILEILLYRIYGVSINDTIQNILNILNIAALFGLPIVAIVCGSIDLRRIKNGKYSNKGKSFDITGIVLGLVFILAVIGFALSDAPIFH
jgi:hypothetical protein